MKTIYNAILKKLESDMPEIRWADYDKGQMNFERPPVAFPCALISIEVRRASNLNNHIQLAGAVVRIKLCFDFTGNTSLATPEAERLKSLDYLTQVDKLYSTFQGWSTDEFNPLSRINNYERDRPDNYKENITEFETQYHEAT